ncbi:MAG: Rrf2 family transcriptional regulator [Filomicrobium sp.]
MRMPKQISDAIRILVWCYRSDELVKVASVAEELGITRQMALKLSNILRQLGLLETSRGPSGGIKLSPLARDATIGNIVRTLLKRPELRKEAREDADFGSLYSEAMDAFLAVLDKEKLSDLATRAAKPKKKPAAAKRPARASKKATAVAAKKRTRSASGKGRTVN